MKRSIALIVITLLVASCSQSQGWKEEQREEFITSLNPYRQMVYVNELDDDEFVLFTDLVSGNVEQAYPIYTQFVVMPSLSDTVDMWVVSTIVDELDADVENMRYLYPYHMLVKQGILPEGLDHAARLSFYRCFAQKVNAEFTTVENFFYAVITNAMDPNDISKMQSECAAELFDFIVEVDTEAVAVEED